MRLRMFTAPAQQTGLPPNVVPWSPGWKTSATRSPNMVTPRGRPAADALCRGDDVGLQTVVHIAVEAAAAAVAELDLVCHEQQVMLAADLLQAGGEFLPDGAHAALALARASKRIAAQGCSAARRSRASHSPGARRGARPGSG